MIDVDGHNFPNLPLMKLSAWHKSQGDSVEWYNPLFHSIGEPLDKELFWQLIDSGAWIDFSQGLDIRMMTEEKAEMINQIKVNNIHFAWDKYEDKSLILPKFKMFKEITGLDYRSLTVYMLTNFNTTMEEDLERVYTLRDLGFNPYVMIYNKDEFVECDKNGKPIGLKREDVLLKKYSKSQIEHFNICWQIQRWVNNRVIFRSCDRFTEFDRSKRVV